MRRLSRPRACPRSRQDGVAAIEMALVGMSLIFFLAGLLQIGRALWHYNALVKATGDAARYFASVPSAELGTAENTARTMILTAASGAGVTIPSPSDNISITCADVAGDPQPCAGAAEPADISVAVVYIVTDNLFRSITGNRSRGRTPYEFITIQPGTTMPRLGYWSP